MDFFISLQQVKFLTSRSERDTGLWKTAWRRCQVEREKRFSSTPLQSYYSRQNSRVLLTVLHLPSQNHNTRRSETYPPGVTAFEVTVDFSWAHSSCGQAVRLPQGIIVPYRAIPTPACLGSSAQTLNV